MQDTLEQIDIYTHSSFPDFLLPDILLYFKKKYADLSINYRVVTNPGDFISRSCCHPVISLIVSNDKEALQSASRKQGNAPVRLMEGEYRCLISRSSPLAKKHEVTMDDLKNQFMVIASSEGAECANGFLSPSMQDIVNQRVLTVETLTNVIKLVSQNLDTYTLSYYPALKRYDEVVKGNLIYLPLREQPTKSSLVMFYARQAYDQHAIVRELTQAIRRAAKQFLSNHEKDNL